MDFISRYKRKITLICTGIVAAAIIVCAVVAVVRNRMNTDIYSDIRTDIQMDDSDSVSGDIKIHIKGAVVNEGLYSLKRGSRVDDAVNAAGGFTEDANIETVNLAAFLEDGEELIIPGTVSSQTDTRIDINTAIKEQLMSLPGVGEGFADRIIEYRDSHGGFKKTSELMNISGFGEKRYEQLKSLVKVG